MNATEMLKRLIEHNKARKAVMDALLVREEEPWMPPKAVMARKILMDDGVCQTDTLWRLAEVLLDFKMPGKPDTSSILERPSVKAWRPEVWDAYVPLTCGNGHSYPLGAPFIIPPTCRAHHGAIEEWQRSSDSRATLSHLAILESPAYGNWIRITPEEILLGHLRCATEDDLSGLSPASLDWLTSQFPEK